MSRSTTKVVVVVVVAMVVVAMVVVVAAVAEIVTGMVGQLLAVMVKPENYPLVSLQ